MDRRRKVINQDVERELRAAFYEEIKAGKFSISEAVVKMRRISLLTQPEFAKHRDISIGTLKQIESGIGNPKIETLNQIAAIFGLEVGFVPKRKRESK